MIDRFWILYDRNPAGTVLGVIAAIAFALILALFGVARCQAADATLTWSNPSARTDGTALSALEIKQTEIDYALCSTGNTLPPTVTTKVVLGAMTTTTVTGLAYGTWCFRARTVDTTGVASVNTGTVFRVYLAPPNAPTLLTVATIAYELRMYTGGTLRFVAVGTVPLKATCGQALVSGYAAFPDAKITKPVTGGILAAKCG